MAHTVFVFLFGAMAGAGALGVALQTLRAARKTGPEHALADQVMDAIEAHRAAEVSEALAYQRWQRQEQERKNARRMMGVSE